MITNDVSTCPKCGGDLKYTDDDFSLVLFVRKYQFGKLSMYGTTASALKPPHGDLPGLSSFRPYNPSNTVGVLEGFITCETIGFEDYPCEMTMVRWQAQNWTTEVVLTKRSC